MSHILLEPSYPKLSMCTLKVDLVPLVWPTAPPKVRKPRFLAAKKRPFLGLFFGLNQFSCQTVDFRLQHVTNIWKAIMTLSYNLVPISVHPVMRQIFANTVQPNWTPDMTPCHTSIFNILYHSSVTLYTSFKLWWIINGSNILAKAGVACLWNVFKLKSSNIIEPKSYWFKWLCL